LFSKISGVTQSICYTPPLPWVVPLSCLLLTTAPSPLSFFSFPSIFRYLAPVTARLAQPVLIRLGSSLSQAFAALSPPYLHPALLFRVLATYFLGLRGFTLRPSLFQHKSDLLSGIAFISLRPFLIYIGFFFLSRARTSPRILVTLSLFIFLLSPSVLVSFPKLVPPPTPLLT